MPVVPEVGRLLEMRRLGLSEPLLRLAAGEVLHPIFDGYYVGPPYFADEGGLFPDGPWFIAFWSCNGNIQGVWEVEGELEFLRVYESNPTPSIVARTEQGFLAWIFMDLYESALGDEEEMEGLPVAAELVNYLHYDRWVAELEDSGIEGPNAIWTFGAAFVAQIDSLKTSRDRQRG
jgi:hypothetical protein